MMKMKMMKMKMMKTKKKRKALWIYDQEKMMVTLVMEALVEILLDCDGVGWKENDNMFIGDFANDSILKRKNISQFIQDINHFIHILLVLLMIAFFEIYCDLSNYHSLLNSFNKYDFFAENLRLFVF